MGFRNEAARREIRRNAGETSVSWIRNARNRLRNRSWRLRIHVKRAEGETGAIQLNCARNANAQRDFGNFTFRAGVPLGTRNRPCRRLRGSESGISQLRNRGRGYFAIAEFGSRGRPAFRNCATRISEFRNDRRKYPRAAASTRNQGRNCPHQDGRTAGRNPKSRRFRISESLRPQFRNFGIEPGRRNPARAGSADAETPTESRAQRTPADAKDAAGISKSGDAADPEFRNPPPRHSARLAIANGIRNCVVLRNRVSQLRNPETQAPGCLAPLISRGFRMPHRDCGLAPRASRNYANPSVFLNRALASGLRKLQLQTSELGVASRDKLTTLHRVGADRSFLLRRFTSKLLAKFCL